LQDVEIDAVEEPTDEMDFDGPCDLVNLMDELEGRNVMLLVLRLALVTLILASGWAALNVSVKKRGVIVEDLNVITTGSL
jgi:hypothetical protein